MGDTKLFGKIYGCIIGGAIGEAEYVAGLERAGLTDVVVEDRLVYDATQLGGLVDSELAQLFSCCGNAPPPQLIERAVKELFLIASVVPVLIFLPFHIELRYFAPMLPLLLLWLAKGIDADRCLSSCIEAVEWARSLKDASH